MDETCRSIQIGCGLLTIGWMSLAENDKHEMVIIERGRDEEGNFIMTTTVPSNDWNRIIVYYESGITTETFER